MNFTAYMSGDEKMIEDSVRMVTGADVNDARFGAYFGGQAHGPEDRVMTAISDEKELMVDGAMVDVSAEKELAAHLREGEAMVAISDEKELAAHVHEGGAMVANSDEKELSIYGPGDASVVFGSDEKDIITHYASEDPYIGMQFESEHAAMVYYDAYAKRIGFVIRVGNCHRSGRDNSIISRRFLCNKEGFRVTNNKTKRNENRKPRETTREGCHAMIMVRREKSGKWVISKLETEHCHPLGLPASKGRRGSVQARPQDEKDKKIRELTLELHRANLRLAECREQLNMILNDAERHTDHLSKTVQQVVDNVKEIEAEDQDASSYRLLPCSSGAVV